MTREEWKKMREENNGALPAWAWPGGYEIHYLTYDGGVLCHRCANGRNRSLAREWVDMAMPTAEEAQWALVGCDVHYEGDPLYCDHCGAVIESAYGPRSGRERSEAE